MSISLLASSRQHLIVQGLRRSVQIQNRPIPSTSNFCLLLGRVRNWNFAAEKQEKALVPWHVLLPQTGEDMLSGTTSGSSNQPNLPESVMSSYHSNICPAQRGPAFQRPGRYMSNKTFINHRLLWQTSGEMEQQPVKSLQESPEELNSFDYGSHVGIYAQYKWNKKISWGTERTLKSHEKLLQKVTPSSLAPMVLLGLKTVRSQIKFYQK